MKTDIMAWQSSYREEHRRRQAAMNSRAMNAIALVGSVGVGTLGGLIGLGGAEFRLPLLMGVFLLPPLEAIVLNKALSLVVVTSALPFRTSTVPLTSILAAWPVVINVLAGSVAGAWLGASSATRLSPQALRHIIAVLLIMMAVGLLFSSQAGTVALPFTGMIQILTALLAGLAIGIIASLLGVAGGELIIPTLIMLFGIDIQLAGSLSLAISVPTMLTAFVRYSYDRSFTVLRVHRALLGIMVFGSVAGTFLGGRLLGVFPHSVLTPLLATILIVSAVKLWQHKA